jgi:uncharacterized membrane protein
MAIVFAIITLVGWAVGDIFGALSSRKIGSISSFFWCNLLALIITSFYIPFAGKVESVMLLLFAFILGLINAYGTLSYFRAMEKGIASLVGAIGGSSSVITVLFSLIFFGEKITFVQLIGIILAIVGVILVSLDFSALARRKIGEVISDRSVRYALIPFFCWGIYFAFIRIPAETLGWFWAYYPLNFSIFVLLPLGIVKPNLPTDFADRRNNLYLLLFCLFITAAMFAYNLGILSGYTSIVAPIAGSFPVLFVILARFIFKDRLNRQQMAGIISALAGIVIIGSGL